MSYICAQWLSDFDIIGIPEVIFEARALKFHIVGPLTGLLGTSDGFNQILIYVFFNEFSKFHLIRYVGLYW